MDKKEKRSFWRDGLSIDETKFSILVVMLIIGFVFALTYYVLTGDFSINLLQLIIALITAVAGVNISSSIANAINNRKHEDNRGEDYEDRI